jgi:peptidylprolyl isomerase domain and WD repeat-containing protein 1
MDELPISKYYEKSLMHRDTVTFSNYLNLVLVSKINDFIFTCSNDGHLKFWKKAYKTIEFIKHFRAHVGAISSLSLSPSHEYLATVSPQDK